MYLHSHRIQAEALVQSPVVRRYFNKGKEYFSTLCLYDVDPQKLQIKHP